ncbi:hypothetical protein [Streptomyces sp. VRA16 Mangrove soil]|uniref:hypothetical protein n=1 Tax=Streptomyces sp. VRA16 Mangrove soil TaxID=2817434 RepID=UPI001A9ECD88|nr:hypothetical protein [Streptomyces sp. VRA16 Mangrove soil]MBO1334898.1 hypothetical protein [Streptomyces sp. VRA16 Mangrove soil]
MATRRRVRAGVAGIWLVLAVGGWAATQALGGGVEPTDGAPPRPGTSSPAAGGLPEGCTTPSPLPSPGPDGKVVIGCSRIDAYPGVECPNPKDGTPDSYDSGDFYDSDGCFRDGAGVGTPPAVPTSAGTCASRPGEAVDCLLVVRRR